MKYAASVVAGAVLLLVAMSAFPQAVIEVSEPGSLSVVLAAVLGGLAAYRLRHRK